MNTLIIRHAALREPFSEGFFCENDRHERTTGMKNKQESFFLKYAGRTKIT